MYHSDTPPGKNQNLFPKLTVRTYVWIVPYWTLHQSASRSIERRVLVCNLLYLTLRTYDHTLLQSPVWDDPYVGTSHECGEKIRFSPGGASLGTEFQSEPLAANKVWGIKTVGALKVSHHTPKFAVNDSRFLLS